jgi:hypothetical protein
VLALATLIAGPAVARADCVASLATCAVTCDQQTRPGRPDRPQCAQSCVAIYQRCERIELFQSTTGGVLNQGNILAPAE